MANHIEKIQKYVTKNKVGKILPYLKSKDKAVRLAAIEALGHCGGEDAVNQLTALLLSPDAEERAAVAGALGELGKEQSFFLLNHYVDKETDPHVAEAMRKAMAKIRQKTHQA